MRILVINLDEDTERRVRVERRLCEIGLGWERLSAVDGRRLTPMRDALIDRDAQAKLGLRVSSGEVGCGPSHRLAQRMVAEGPDDAALILEDDIRIHEDLPEALERISQGTAGEFDVIRRRRFKLRRKYVPIRDIGDGRTIGLVRPADSGAQAYVMTRGAARRIVGSIPRMVQPAEHTLYQHWIHGLVVCSLDPPVVSHLDGGRSSIAAPPAPGGAFVDPWRWTKRKRHQLQKKLVRGLAFVSMLNQYSRNGRLSGLA